MIGVSEESIFEVDSNIDVVEDDGFIILAEDSMVSCFILILTFL